MHMDMTIRVYHNPFYEPYKCSCYMVYIPLIGVFIVTKDDAFIVLDSNVSIDKENLPGYCRSRGFVNIVDIADDYKKIIWYDQYSDLQSRQSFVNAMEMAKTIISQRYIYNLSKSPIYRKVYSAFNNLSQIKVE